MKNFVAFAAVAAAAFATPAAAQDTAAVAAPAGPRVEALVGFDHGKVAGESDNGLLFGIGAGYDFAVNDSVALGVDVEATESTLKNDDLGIEIKAGRDLYAGGRLSFAIAPNSNVYAKAGYTNARLKAEGLGGENLDGLRLGAGAQFGLGGKAYVGGEYRYSNYESDFSRHQLALTVGTRF